MSPAWNSLLPPGGAVVEGVLELGGAAAPAVVGQVHGDAHLPLFDRCGHDLSFLYHHLKLIFCRIEK